MDDRSHGAQVHRRSRWFDRPGGASSGARSTAAPGQPARDVHPHRGDGADRGRRGPAGDAAPGRGHDLRAGQRTGCVSHRHRLLQRDRHLPRDRGSRPGERVVGRGEGLVRLHRRRFAVPRALQGQSGARGTPVRGVGRGGVGGRHRGRRAPAPRRRGRRVRPVGARRDPPSPRRPGGLGGRIRPGPGDGRRSATRLRPAAVREGSGAGSRRRSALGPGATADRAAARPRVGGERRRRTGLRRSGRSADLCRRAPRDRDRGGFAGPGGDERPCRRRAGACRRRIPRPRWHRSDARATRGP